MTTIIEAAQAGTILEAALEYASMGMSVIPVQGKIAAVDWKPYQCQRASHDQIQAWARGGLLSNVGIVCGTISRSDSGTLAVIDLDGEQAVDLFYQKFPALVDTYTVLTGSGRGRHLYYWCGETPHTTRTKNDVGGFELRSDGCYVVAPPSAHPQTAQTYRVSHPAAIMRVATLDVFKVWVIGMIKAKHQVQLSLSGSRQQMAAHHPMNRRLIRAIEQDLTGKGYKVKNGWLFGSCLFPENHEHGDKSPSFGFDTVTGRAHCFVCGFIRTIDVCIRLRIDVNGYGGLWEK